MAIQVMESKERLTDLGPRRWRGRADCQNARSSVRQKGEVDSRSFSALWSRLDHRLGSMTASG
jgi:hypothetical protein